MDTKSLTIFQHLAGSLHFAKTADAFHMSPSTLSRLIQRMESQTDCQLLDRDNRTVQLTQSGKRFLDYANQQLEEWQLLKNSIDIEKKHLTGKLHIFCSVTAAYSHLPPLLDRFRQQHPQVEILLTTGDASDAIAHVQNKSVDIAIAAKPENFPDTLKFAKIADIPLSVIAPRSVPKIHYLLHQATSSDNRATSWQQIPFILPDHGPARKRFERWFSSKTSQRPNIYATVSGHEALVSMVALGCGVGIAPKVVVENSPVKNRVDYLGGLGHIEPFDLGICSLAKKNEQPIIRAFFNTRSVLSKSYNRKI